MGHSSTARPSAYGRPAEFTALPSAPAQHSARVVPASTQPAAEASTAILGTSWLHTPATEASVRRQVPVKIANEGPQSSAHPAALAHPSAQAQSAVESSSLSATSATSWLHMPPAQANACLHMPVTDANAEAADSAVRAMVPPGVRLTNAPILGAELEAGQQARGFQDARHDGLAVPQADSRQTLRAVPEQAERAPHAQHTQHAQHPAQSEQGGHSHRMSEAISAAFVDQITSTSTSATGHAQTVASHDVHQRAQAAHVRPARQPEALVAGASHTQASARLDQAQTSDMPASSHHSLASARLKQANKLAVLHKPAMSARLDQSGAAAKLNELEASAHIARSLTSARLNESSMSATLDQTGATAMRGDGAVRPVSRLGRHLEGRTAEASKENEPQAMAMARAVPGKGQKTAAATKPLQPISNSKVCRHDVNIQSG